MSRRFAIAAADLVTEQVLDGLDQLLAVPGRPPGEVASRCVLPLQDGTVLLVEARRPG